MHKTDKTLRFRWFEGESLKNWRKVQRNWKCCWVKKKLCLINEQLDRQSFVSLPSRRREKLFSVKQLLPHHHQAIKKVWNWNYKAENENRFATHSQFRFEGNWFEIAKKKSEAGPKVEVNDDFLSWKLNVLLLKTIDCWVQVETRIARKTRQRFKQQFSDA